jgi:hypothetical protein
MTAFRHACGSAIEAAAAIEAYERRRAAPPTDEDDDLAEVGALIHAASKACQISFEDR